MFGQTPEVIAIVSDGVGGGGGGGVIYRVYKLAVAEVSWWKDHIWSDCYQQNSVV